MGGYSYLTDSSTYGNYFIRGNGDDVHIRDDLTTGGNITASGSLNGATLGRSNCTWTTEQAGANQFCPTGKYQAGWTQRMVLSRDIWGHLSIGLYQQLYCCNP